MYGEDIESLLLAVSNNPNSSFSLPSLSPPTSSPLRTNASVSSLNALTALSLSLQPNSPSKEPDITVIADETSSGAAPIRPEALLNHLGSLHLLLQSMERRFLEREGELEEIEKRAREGEERAKGLIKAVDS
jgi:hypothetical protein